MYIYVSFDSAKVRASPRAQMKFFTLKRNLHLAKHNQIEEYKKIEEYKIKDNQIEEREKGPNEGDYDREEGCRERLKNCGSQEDPGRGWLGQG